MILNLSVEVSDEVIQLFGYSLYERNKKKSEEAEKVFERLFSTLQAELEKDYQSTARDLRVLDKRLKVLEEHAADAEAVDNAINKLNNRMARIDSTLTEYERQQKNIAKQMEQVEATVDQFYNAINDDIGQLRKDFATKLKTEVPTEVARLLKSEVSTEVERLLKRILANNFNETIKTSIDAVLKDYDFPKPDYDATIKAEVANAVRNIPAPNYDATIKAEVANAIRNIPAPNYDATIKAEIANAVKNIPAPNYDATIKAEVANAIKNIFAPNYDATIKAEVANAIKNIFAPNFNAIIQTKIADAVRNILAPNFNAVIQTKIADAVKLELQRAQAGNATVPAYVYQNKVDKLLAKIEEQNATINAQQKSIQELQGLVKDLTARFSDIEKKSPDTIVEPEAEIILNVRDENSWQEYKKRLQDIGKLEQFAKNNSANFHSFAARLSKIKKAIDKINPQEFDEYTTETIVDKTADIAKEFMSFLETCNRTINNPRKNSADAQKLYNLIEEYLSGLGIRSMNFEVGGNYEEWADLGMSEQPITEDTNDKKKHNILKEINVQPHFIEYLNEHDKKARRVFGGRCVAYAYKD